MIKLINGINRKPGMSVEEFQRHWREIHGPITARLPGVRRYVQCHTPPELYTGVNIPAYDGVGELWFDDMAAMQQAMASPELNTAREDERNFFIDHSRTFFVVTEEKPIVE